MGHRRRSEAVSRREAAEMDEGGFVSTAIRSYLSDVAGLLETVPIDAVARVIDRLEEARCEEQAVFTCGNGGSAATAIHFASDLAKGAAVVGKPAFKAMSLCENVSLVTAWANDVSYEDVFARRMAPWLKPGDVLVAISCSGNSRNVLNAIHRAKAGGATTVGFTAFDGGKMRELVDICVTVRSSVMEQIEDIHLLLCHLITTALRNLPPTPPADTRSRVEWS